MAETVTVLVSFTRDDYVAFLKAIAKTTSSLAKNVLLALCLLCLAYLAYQVAVNKELNPVAVGVGIAVFSLFLYFPIWWLRRFVARRFIDKNPHLLGPTRHTIGPTGIEISSANGASTLNWSAIIKATESPEIFLLFPQSNYAMIVPKRCFSSADEVQAYREILRRYCKDSKGLTT
jgi:hypothetical protein